MSVLEGTSANICAVVVTFFPSPSSVERLRSLALQVAEVLVVDNGSSPDTIALLAAGVEAVGGTLLSLGTNRGVGTALNKALQFAQEKGYAWLATFDQDSQITPAMIAEMTRALQDYPASQQVAIVTPCHVDRRLGFTVRDREDTGGGTSWRVLRTTMTSGNLVRVEHALTVGGFDEGLFIDSVDHEFCLRLGFRGYRILEARRAILLHSLGRMERRWLLFKRITITNHTALRRYYISRNRVIVWRRYWRSVPSWVLRDMRRFVFETSYVVFYETDVRDKLRMVLRGLKDGLRNVQGPFRPDR